MLDSSPARRVSSMDVAELELVATNEPVGNCSYADLEAAHMMDQMPDPVKRARKIEQEDVPFTWVESFLFLVCGLSHLWYWNTLLNFMVDIQTVFYPDIDHISDILAGLFETATLIGVALTVWRGALSQRNNIFWGCVFFAGCVLTPIAIGSFPAEKQTASCAMFFVIAVITGVAAGYQQSIHFAFAACMPGGVVSGWVSVGQGICGVLTFGLFMLFSEKALVGRSLTSLWILMAINMVLIVASTIAAYYVCQRPGAVQHIEASRAAIKEEKSDPMRPSSWHLLKSSYPGVLNVFFAFFVTFMVYPNVAPLRFGDSVTHTNVGMGMFQTGNLVGRLIPNAATWLPALLLSPKALTTGNALRLVLVVFAILSSKLQGSPFWSSVAWHHVLIFVLATTEGWFGTVGLIRSPMAVMERYRGRVSALSVVALLLGVALGLWCIHIIKFI
eukprot:Gregarina_sp_Pseudo_9__621@NODE_1399_length_1635_cov_128_866541_g1302_i0_p1_GENE_NODE_1399_length_1635_cov_128_866541_g1302_i0NODE_1399_length_1635_cov_128_866541_g1302_i0_p1_ORF_typecomplete_len445_score55_06Nucleoside_tran/PF01733_18/2_7e03Nucleoside_tran/PF01733_18/3e33_NODE_1399_length_1635_cov_128_866541_g1302_i0781412